MAQKNSTPFISVYCLPVTLFSAAFSFTLVLCDQLRRESDQRGRECNHEGKACDHEGRPSYHGRRGFSCLSKPNPTSSRPYVFFVPSHDLAAPLELAPVWRGSAFPGLGGGVPPHRPARQRGFSAAKNPEVFITED